MCQTCYTYVKLRRPHVSFSISLSCLAQFPSLQQHEEYLVQRFHTDMRHKHIHTSTLRFLYFVLYHGRVINHSQVKMLFDIFRRKCLWGKKRWRRWTRTGGLVSCIMSRLFLNRTRTLNISSTTLWCATT